MHLRDYQSNAVAAIQDDWHAGYTDVLLVAATGAGKTNIFLSLLMHQLDAGPSRALVLAHRQELIDQPLDRIRSIDEAWLWRSGDLRPRVGVVMAERNQNDCQLTIATVQTLASEKRLAGLLTHGPIDYLVVDECHHAVAASYVKILNALREANPQLRHLGVTATPLRADGDGLAKVYQRDSAKVTIADLVKLGYLVQPRWLGITTGISIAGVHTRQGDFVQGELAAAFDTAHGRQIVLKAFRDFASTRRALAFCASVEGAHKLAEAFTEAGYSAAAIDGTTPKEVRRQILADFRAGKIQILANCQVLTEGFDAPGTNCILMCRPTRSDSLYIQCMGRGLRPALGMAQPGEDCLVLDFMPVETRNIVMAGDVLGLPKEVTRTVLKEQADEELEEGAVQAGFTFDGEHFDSSGTPLEIIARQLDYLTASPFVWYRRSGWMTLGLGKGADDNERILAILPGGPGYRLYGLIKPQGDARQWQHRLLVEGSDLTAIGDYANDLASTRASGTLVSKGRGWQAQPASDGQRNYLKRLARGELKQREIEAMNKGEAAQLISYFQARQALAWVDSAMEVAA